MARHHNGVKRPFTVTDDMLRRSVIGRLWLMIAQPRVRRVLWSFIYASIAVAGFSAMLAPPNAVRSEIGTGLTLAWGAMALVGGALGAWSTLTRWWVIERAAIILCGHSAIIYAILIFSNHIGSPGNRIPQLMYVIGFGFALAVRFYDIRRFNKRPV